MGYNDADVYFQPEKFGLKIIGHIEDPEAYYSFDDLVVWQHEDGRLFYAQDSGCSCPSPFEDFTSLESLTLITNETWESFQKAVLEHASWREDDDDERSSFTADKAELVAKVSRLL